jgi:hypothetical protein
MTARPSFLLFWGMNDIPHLLVFLALVIGSTVVQQERKQIESIVQRGGG